MATSLAVSFGLTEPAAVESLLADKERCATMIDEVSYGSST